MVESLLCHWEGRCCNFGSSAPGAVVAADPALGVELAGLRPNGECIKQLTHSQQVVGFDLSTCILLKHTETKTKKRRTEGERVGSVFQVNWEGNVFAEPAIFCTSLQLEMLGLPESPKLRTIHGPCHVLFLLCNYLCSCSCSCCGTASGWSAGPLSQSPQALTMQPTVRHTETFHKCVLHKQVQAD